MQFMEYTTLLLIHPSELSAAIQNNAIYHGIQDVIAYRPEVPPQENAVDHQIQNVIAYRPC